MEMFIVARVLKYLSGHIVALNQKFRTALLDPEENSRGKVCYVQKNTFVYFIDGE